MHKQLALVEGKYEDSVEKYDDLLAPVDEIDLQQAEADLALAEALVLQTRQDLDRLQHGPDPDEVALAERRIRAAEAALQAAQAAFEDAFLTAPFAGQVLSIPAQEHEWVTGGQTVLVLADQAAWEVAVDDLEEDEVIALQVGQPVSLSVDALPGLELAGIVDSLSLVYNEEDGDVTYSGVIRLDQSDPRLKWGMTTRFDTP
jgi:multidrug resistance efflux pump